MLIMIKCVGITFFNIIILKGRKLFTCVLVYYCFNVQIIALRHSYPNIHIQVTSSIKNMLGSIPHQKLCFYHLPTRGRAGIKLGDA